MTVAPIIKKQDRVFLSGRCVIESKVIDIQVCRQDATNKYSNQFTQETSLSLKVTLANGYWFYTPKRIVECVTGLRTESGKGYCHVFFTGECEWFDIKKGETDYDAKFDVIRNEDTATPTVKVGDTIKIKGTVVEGTKRLNRVVKL